MFRNLNRTQNKRLPKTYKPLIDELESRLLLAWSPLGPRTQIGWPVPNSIFAGAVAGRVTSLGYLKNFVPNNDAIVMGTAGGGIWMYQDGLNPLNWRPITEAITDFDNNPITDPRILERTKSIGAIAVDPADPQVIYAGTGEGNYSADCGFGAGILKSENAGLTWKLATGLAPGQSQFFGHAVSKIFIDPLDRQFVYAAVVPAGESLAQGRTIIDAYRNFAGIYQSHNGGRNWARIWDGGANAPIIVTDMDFTVIGPGGLQQINILAGVANPFDNGEMGAGQMYHTGTGRGIQRGFFTAAGGARNWDFTTQVRQEPTARRIALATGRGVAGARTIYAALVGQDGVLARVLKSVNNGATWADASPNPQQRARMGNIGSYALTLAIDSTNANIAVLGGQGRAALNRSHTGGGLLETRNGGGRWDPLDGPSGANPLGWNPGAASNVEPHVDHHALLILNDTRGRRLYDGNDGGIYRRAGFGTTWVNWNTATGQVGLETNLVNAVGVQTGNIGNLANVPIWEGSQDNGLAKRVGIVGPTPWTTESRTLGAVAAIFRPNQEVAGDAGMVRVNPAGTGVYMVTQHDHERKLVMWAGNPDMNQNWEMISPVGNVGRSVSISGGAIALPIGTDRTFPFYPVFAISPTEHNVRLSGDTRRRNWVAVGSEYVWQREAVPGAMPTADWTFRWRNLNPVDGMGVPQRLNTTVGRKITAITYQNDDVLYVGYDDGKIFKYFRGVWTQFDRPAGGANWHPGAINSISLDPQSPGHVYVATDSFVAGRQVYRTTNGGVNWTNLSGAGMTQIPILPARTLIVDHPVNSAVTLFVGNDAGVYIADDMGVQQWRRFDTALPYVQVNDLQRVGTTNRFLAATYGRGVWTVTYNRPGGMGLNPRSDFYGIDVNGTLTVSPSGVLENDFPDSAGLVGATSTWVSVPSYGSLVLQSDGSFVYTPNPGFQGEDSFVYMVTDQGGATATANVYIEVETLPSSASPFQIPDATDDLYTTTHDTPLDSTQLNWRQSVLDNDYEFDGQPLLVSAVNGVPANVGLTITLVSGATLRVLPNGTFQYTPPSGFIGSDWFTYTASDGLYEDIAIVTIDVQNAVLVWDGGASDNLWSSPQNWSGDILPIYGDEIGFNSTSSKSALLDSAYPHAVDHLYIEQGYTGTITLNRDLTITGHVIQEGGTIVGPSTFIVSAGALFEWVAGNVNTHLANYGELFPGMASIAAVNTLNGNFSQSASGLWSIDLGVPTTNSDQLIVSGAVTLDGSLSVNALPEFSGDYFILIDKTSPGAVVGTFFDLPEGTILLIGDRSFTISYIGGDGNDVVLTAMEIPAGGGGNLMAIGPDAGRAPLVRVYDTAARRQRFAFLAFPTTFLGGVRVAMGDVNGDGRRDIIAAAGPGGGGVVKVFSGANGTLLYTFTAGDVGFTGGINVAVGDVNGDGKADVIAGMDAGGVPRVRVYSGASGAVLYNFVPYDVGFRGGVRVAAGDVNGDGRSDIIVAPGAGTATLIKTYSGATGLLLSSLQAFSIGYTGGAYIAAGDVNGDGRADIIVGSGAGSPPLVNIYSGATGALLRSFLAYDAAFTGGVRVAARDVTGDGIADILVGGGSGSREARLYHGLTTALLDRYFAFEATFSGGLFVG